MRRDRDGGEQQETGWKEPDYCSALKAIGDFGFSSEQDRVF